MPTPSITTTIPVRNSTRNLGEWFDGNTSQLTVGDSLGESAAQGAYDRWPVFEAGERVGTLFDDASGTTYGAVDNDGEAL